MATFGLADFICLRKPEVGDSNSLGLIFKFNSKMTKYKDSLYTGPDPQREIDAMHDYAKNLTSGPDAKEKCRQFLMDVGICDDEGKLTEEYGGPGKSNASFRKPSRLEQKADEHS